MKKVNHSGLKTGVGVGIGVAALATVAGMYFFGKKGEKHREEVKDWADNIKYEVLKKVGALEDVSEGAYHSAVESVVAAYNGVKNIDTGELQKLAAELKNHWKNIKKDIETGAKSSNQSPKKKS